MLMAVQARESSAHASEWQASLALRYARTERTERRTVLAHNAHRGPLRVQRALYPEGPNVCHTVVLHPPSGIAAGDVLSIDIDAAPGTHAVLTTPGSTKWYRRAAVRAPGLPGRQDVRITARGDAIVEWLPQPNLVYEHADARATLRIDLDAPATCLGIDLVVLGRRASGERFDDGAWRQRIEVRRSERLIWLERAAFVGSDALLHSALGLDGRAVVCTVFASAPRPIDEALLAGVRAAVPDAGVTCPDAALLVARWCVDSPQDAWDAAVRAWSVLRLALTGYAAIAPRLWAT